MGFWWFGQPPLGEASELYDVLVQGVSGATQRAATSPPMTFSGADLAALGSGPATITVRQIGDWAGSRPVTTETNLP